MMRTLSFSLLALLVLAACESPLVPATGTSLSITATAQPTRSLAPASASVAIDTYELAMVGPGGALTDSNTNGNFSVSGLVAGHWTILVMGLHSGKAVAQAKATADLPAQPSVSLILTPQNVGGTGTLALTTTWPGGMSGVVEARGTLTPLDAQTNGGASLSALLAVTGNTASWPALLVPVGIYQLSLALTGPQGAHAYAPSEAVTIYPDTVTTGTVQVSATPGLSLKNQVTTLAGLAPTAFFSSPEGVLFDPVDQVVYIADGVDVPLAGQTIKKLDLNRGKVFDVAGTQNVWGYTDARPGVFHRPMGMVKIGKALYVMDSDNSAVRKVDLSTGTVSTFCTGVGNSDDMTTDGTNLYIAESSGNLLSAVSLATGLRTVLAGDGTNASTDGTGAAAQFAVPYGLVYDNVHSCLWVVDYNDGSVRKVTLPGAVVTTFATGLTAPYGIAIDDTSANLYVTDMSDNSISQISIPGAVVTPIAGGNGAGGADGIGAVAQFSGPTGIAFDPTRKALYVADTGNNTLRLVDLTSPSYTVSTLAGAAPASAGATDGPSGAARFSAPSGMASDGTSLYVGDLYNASVRRISIATGNVTTLPGTIDNPHFLTTDGRSLYSVGDVEKLYRYNLAALAVPSTFSTTGTQYRGLANDGTKLYLADATLNKVVQMNLDLSDVGTPTDLTAMSNSAAFTNLTDLTTDGTNLYVVDGTTGNQRLCRIPLGSPGSAADLVTQSTLTALLPAGYSINGLTTDGAYLYASATKGGVLKIDLLTGSITKVAGSEVAGYADGTGRTVRFSEPRGLATDGSSLFVVESGNNTLRVIR